jgi:FkbM family methyltransferase
MRLWSRGDDWVSNQVFWRGWDGYEPETTPIFFRLAERASVTVDIGAHVGFHTVLAGLANPAGRVFAFEPMPAALMRLRRHVQLNQLENADVVAAAVAAETGQAEFFHTEVQLPCSASLDEAFMSWHADSRPMTVRTICLDEFLAERGVARVDLVKLDIETGEPDALRGMRHMLARDHPPIVCEVLPVDGVAERLEEELRPLGYEYHHLTPGGPLRRDRIVPDPTYTNYLFSTR